MTADATPEPTPPSEPTLVGLDDPGFPVEFDDPADMRLTWERDDMHMPFAVTPLAADYAVDIVGESFNEHWRMFGGPQHMRGHAWNGYVYYAFQANVPDEERPAFRERWTEVVRSRIAVTKTWWDSEALPELAAIYDEIQAIPVDDLSGSDLAAAWDRTWERLLRAWQIHFIAIMGPYQVLEDLSDAYGSAMGPGKDAEALALVEGAHHELEDVEAGAERLAAVAAASPQVSGRLTRDGPAPTREEIAALPGGEAFITELDAYLRQHGHLGQNHDDLALASWADEPEVFLAKLAKRIDQPARPAADRQALQAQEAQAVEARVRAALADKPDELAKFEEVLRHAREVGYLTEGHNYWIDRMAQARLRTFVLRVGSRLAREGRIAAADDIFFLHSREVAETLRGGQDRRSLVEERRATHAVDRLRTAPPIIGMTRAVPGATDRFDGERHVSSAANELKGTGASAGVVRGTARVALGTDDFARIFPGDIIVCPSSNPSWVPVFTIAGGLVTNTGGILSHAALVAREFGLPAVVGVPEATSKIRDGQTIEIDGTTGTVRLL
jgi:phosphohistidine swiveling domain-containing protein